MVPGREGELERIGALLADGGALVLRGEPGIGKTTLLAEAGAPRVRPRLRHARGERAALRGAARAPWAPHRRDPGARARWPAAGAARAHGGVARAPRAARGAGAGRGARRRRAPARRRVRRRARVRRPPSRRRRRDPPRRARRRPGGARRARDAPRSPRCAEAVARELLARDAPDLAPGVRDAILAAAHGNPLALAGAARGADAAPSAPAREVLPDPLPAGPALRARVPRLGARRPGRAAPRRGRRDRRGRATASGRGPARVDPAGLDELEEAGLARIADGRLELAHPLLRAAALADATDRARREAHLALAAVARRRPAPPGTARSRPRARTRRSPPSSSARRPTARCSSARRRSPPTGRARARRLLAAAEAHWRAGRTERVGLLLAQAEALPGDPEGRAAAAMLRGSAQLDQGAPAEAYEVLISGARQAARGRPDAGAGHAHPRRRGELDVRSHGVDRRPRRARRAGRRGRRRRGVLHGRAAAWASGGCCATRTPTLGPLRDALALASTLRAPAPPAARLHPRRVARRRPRRADRDADRREPAARVGRAGRAVLRAAAARGVRVAGRAGSPRRRPPRRRPSRSRRRTTRTSSTRTRSPSSPASRRRRATGTPRAQHALASLEASVARGPRAARGRGAVGARPHGALPRPLRGGALAPALHRAPRRTGFASPIPALLSAPDLVEAAVRSGRPELAEPSLRRFEDWQRRTGSAWGAGVAHRMRALTAEGDEAEERFVASLRDAERQPMIEVARTRLHFGELLRRARRKLDARDQLRAALTVFESVGAEPWAERARAELRASGEGVGTAARRRGARRSSRRRSARSRCSSPAARRTARSPRSCSSACARWSTTCTRSTRASGSAPARARRCHQCVSG